MGGIASSRTIRSGLNALKFHGRVAAKKSFYLLYTKN